MTNIGRYSVDSVVARQIYLLSICIGVYVIILCRFTTLLFHIKGLCACGLFVPLGMLPHALCVAALLFCWCYPLSECGGSACSVADPHSSCLYSARLSLFCTIYYSELTWVCVYPSTLHPPAKTESRDFCDGQPTQ